MLRALRLLLLAFLATLGGRLVGRPRHKGWPFSFELVVRYLRLDWAESADWEAPRIRKDMDNRAYPREYAKKVPRVDMELAGVPLSRFSPSAEAKQPGLILYLHGGAYVFGSARSTHRELISRLAFETGLDVVAPDFRLAPEHPYPAQLEDALAVFHALVSKGTPAEQIVVVGDSSGGNLAVELALELRNREEPQPKALGLISPWCDLEMSGRSYEENERYDLGTRAMVRKHALAFAGRLELSDPRISPIWAPLEGLCPSLLIVGELELPRDDILAFYDKLQAANVSVELHMAREMPHVPPAFTGLHPEADVSIRKLASYVQQRLAENESPLRDCSANARPASEPEVVGNRRSSDGQF